MGFSLTCFASQQSISRDDECVIMPVLRQTTYNPVAMIHEDKRVEHWGTSHSGCHPTAFWEPVGSFMRATFDGYGNVELQDDEVTNRRLYWFIVRMLRGAPVVEQGENPSTEIPFDLKGFILEKAPTLHAHIAGGRDSDRSAATMQGLLGEMHQVWEYIWNISERNRLFFPNYLRHLQPVQFAVMHQRAYENLLNVGLTVGRGYRDPVPLEKLVTHASADFPERAKDKSILRDFYFGNSFRDKLSLVGGFESTPYPDEAAETSEPCIDYGSGKTSFEEFVEDIRPTLEVRYVLSGMDVLNIRLQPVTTGSEDPWNDAGRRYAKFIRSTSAQVSRDRKDLMS